MIRILNAFLSDAKLGFLALLSLFLMMSPFVFSLSEDESTFFLGIEYLIVFLFAVEYLSAFILAVNKSLFVRSPWRIIDALIVIFATLSLLPITPDFLLSAPALRLLRLGRLALLGTRSSLALSIISSESEPASRSASRDPCIEVLGDDGKNFAEIPWQEGIDLISNKKQDWLFISGVNEENMPAIAAALDVPMSVLLGLFQSSVPRFARLEHYSTLFFRYPLKTLAGERLQRTPVLLIGTSDNVVVLSPEKTDLAELVEYRIPGLVADTPRMAGAMMALAGVIVGSYTEVVEQLESSLLYRS